MSVFDPEIQLAIVLRSRQFESETSIKCEFSLIRDAFCEVLWSDKSFLTLNNAVDDIFTTSNQTLIDALLQLDAFRPLNLAYEIS